MGGDLAEVVSGRGRAVRRQPGACPGVGLPQLLISPTSHSLLSCLGH